MCKDNNLKVVCLCNTLSQMWRLVRNIKPAYLCVLFSALSLSHSEVCVCSMCTEWDKPAVVKSFGFDFTIRLSSYQQRTPRPLPVSTHALQTLLCIIENYQQQMGTTSDGAQRGDAATSITPLSVCINKHLCRSLSFTVYISLYYVAFYVVMTALFCLAIWTLMYTLDPYAPDYQDRLQSPGNTSATTPRTATIWIKPQQLVTRSLFVVRSGVMVWPDTYGEEDVEITYNSSDKASWMQMSNILHEFLERECLHHHLI